jgi:hypothetical protein
MKPRKIKPVKSDWQKTMRLWQVSLIILLPLIFGAIFWWAAHRNPFGK